MNKKIICVISFFSIFFISLFVLSQSSKIYATYNTSPDGTFVTDGTVNAVTTDSNGIMYVGGNFSNVGQNTGHFAGISPTTGKTISLSQLVDGNVNSIISDGSGGWYIGGSFTTIGGNSIKNLAHITSNNTVDTTFNPNPSSTVNALLLYNGKLYAGGAFTTVNSSVSRVGLAMFDPTTGVADSTFNANISGGSATVLSMLVYNNLLYIGGGFSTLNGTTRNCMAAVNLTSGAFDSNFNPNLSNNVRQILLANSEIYAFGDFTTVNGGTSLVGAVALNSSTGTYDSNFNAGLNSSVYGATLVNSKLYIVGNFITVNTSVTRNRAAAVDVSTGTVDSSFNPNANSRITAIYINGNNVYLGGLFTTMNGSTTANHIAKVDATNGTVDTTFTASLNAEVDVFLQNNTVLFIGGQFAMTDAVARKNFAAFDTNTGQATSFNPNMSSQVRTVAVNGSTIYAGGDFTTVNGSVTRNRIAAFDINGNVISSFDPNSNGSVYVIVFKNNGIYVSGGFNFMSNIARAHIARLNLDGSLDTNFSPPSLIGFSSDFIYAMAFDSQKVYAGGTFSANVSRNRLLALDINSGALDANFNPNINNTVRALTLVGTTLYLGGNFTALNGGAVSRSFLAAVDTTTSLATSFAPAVSGQVNMLTTDGTDLYAVGSISSASSQSVFGFAAFKLSNEQFDTSFVPTFKTGSSVAQMFAVYTDQYGLYVGGQQNLVNSVIRPNFAKFAAIIPTPTPTVAVNPSLTWQDSSGHYATFGLGIKSNAETGDNLPTFYFTQAGGSINKYQIIVSSPTYGSNVYIDNILPTGGYPIFEDDTRWEQYDDFAHTIAVHLKRDEDKLPDGAYKWKVRAISTTGGQTDSDERVLRVRTNQAIFSGNSTPFPISILNIGGKNINISTEDVTTYPKQPITITTKTPTFYGIANVGSHMSLLLVRHHDDENYDETFNYSTDANADSRFGINVSPALAEGKYSVLLSATNDNGDYIEIPQFSLNITRSSSAYNSTGNNVTAAVKGVSTENELSPTPTMKVATQPSPTTVKTQPKTTTHHCLLFNKLLCF